jgi:glucose 1-dehydrogenase
VAAGADVAVNYRGHPDGARRVADQIPKLGRRTAAIQADLGRIQEAQRLVRESVERCGRLDALVNHAGVEERADFWDVTEADYITGTTIVADGGLLWNYQEQ